MTRLALLSCVLVAAGCGGGSQRTTPPQPHLPHVLAQRWAQQAEEIAGALATGDGCTARRLASSLRGDVVQAVNARRVPQRLQETLLGAANALPARIACTLPAPAPAVQPTQPAQHGPPPQAKPPHGHGHGEGHGHGHGHGHGGDH